jgi:hypothetical protein
MPGGVEKLDLSKLAGKTFREEALQTDFLGFPRHFLSPKFSLFWGKWSFSTATPDCDSQ